MHFCRVCCIHKKTVFHFFFYYEEIAALFLEYLEPGVPGVATGLDVDEKAAPLHQIVRGALDPSCNYKQLILGRVFTYSNIGNLTKLATRIPISSTGRGREGQRV